MKKIIFYKTPNGKVPFNDWLGGIKDKITLNKVVNRINMLEQGFMPDFDHVGEGVFETRIHTRGGVRIYYLPYKDAIIVLLCGGIKDTQEKDIRKAISYANEFRSHL